MIIRKSYNRICKSCNYIRKMFSGSFLINVDICNHKNNKQ